MKLLSDAGFTVNHSAYVDSVGVLATLAYRIVGDKDGGISSGSVGLFDKWVFPVSRLLDQVFQRIGGKNVYAVATRP